MNKLEHIKICGISTSETADAVISSGATHLGMIFFEKSPRNVSLEQAQILSSHVGNRVTKVAVTVNADTDFLDQIVEHVAPDVLQLHGSETPEHVQRVKDRFGLPVIKALAIGAREDLEKVKPYMNVTDLFLFDAKPPKGSDLPGGNGVAFDWEIMDDIPENVPYMLSGGLNSENIVEAIDRTGTKGIDISSGVETAPGVKDVKLIEDFLDRLNKM